MNSIVDSIYKKTPFRPRSAALLRNALLRLSLTHEKHPPK